MSSSKSNSGEGLLLILRKPFLLPLLLLLVFVIQPAKAAITYSNSPYNELIFDSMPAEFGMAIPYDTPVRVQLKSLKDYPFLCPSEQNEANNSTLDDSNSTIITASSLNDNTTKTSSNTSLPVALLISRGECSFVEKAHQAAAMNIPYLIVYDDRIEPELVRMNSNDVQHADVGLLFISRPSGEALQELLQLAEKNDNNDPMLILNIDGKLPGDVDGWVLIAMRFFIWFGCIMMCGGFVPADRMAAISPLVSSSSSLTEEEVLRLPTVQHEGGSSDDGACCSICLEEFNHGETLRQLLPCHHEFHTECIVPWLTTRDQRSCPLCKQEVQLVHDDNDDGDDEEEDGSKKQWSWQAWRRRGGRTLVSMNEEGEELELAVATSHHLSNSIV